MPTLPVPLKHRLRKLLALFPPNWCLAILVALDGYAFMHPVLREVRAREYGFWLAIDNWHEVMRVVGLLEIPRLVLGVGLQVIALGLILKARIAWAFSLVLLIGVGTFAIMGDSGRAGLGIYTLVLVIALIAYWRRFDRASVTAGSLFALVSMLSLLIYAVFGTLYLGNEFNPPITDATTALYFSIVSMSTVGYGDITPHTGTARLFTASIIILGITIFATSISAIAGPVIGGNLKRLVKGRFSTAMRKNHIIIAGATPLAMSVYDGLRRRGDEVTVIVPPGVPQEYPAATDLIEGDPSSVDVLHNAGVTRARYVLALRDDDAENAFIVLAAKEACGENGAKTVALVNTSKHLEKIRRVNPDLVFSVQLLGAELLARAINGEPMDSQSITDLFFAKAAPNGKAA
ncbi:MULTISPECIES: voltage-gated potassium channel protein [Achromobacter]|jgi:voltage-gated potassium channel|uniref:Voltage-gated potassium channel Kch n=2 Tax=Achromobacter TaxID=222 RepID=A0AAD2IXL0_ACHAE|nr:MULTISPECIES: voltage-gated potassium channel protein [Achromobacter]MBC9903183.1 voltage-gated potassium channel protein [Achromobacter xylosoxidans]MBD0867773.1 voltage-gated potassium channel protein [Achromobacter xylosoxidans]MBD9382520.1 voltage-gated potassium channel protein [Achromobacter sp. ACM02]MBD9420488.1 voltage-gated potassium channel protein [Achromobacter sp. ACM04]MBD9430637.1 voltage-gated potassium channel protein [Achromobacter sp. ACM03]